MVVFGQSDFIWLNVVVFGQKWLYSGTRGCKRTKAVVFGHK